MKYALFLGCWIQTQQYNYEMSTRSTLPKFGIEIEDVAEFSCCGYPLRSYNASIWLYLGARNLALAEEKDLEILPLCNGCYCSLNEVKHFIDNDKDLKNKVNLALAEEGLAYKGNCRTRHILEVLHEDIGVERIKEAIKKPLAGLKFATHCGCHALRPSVVRYTDDPENPYMLDEITQALGIETPYYPEKLDCCGAGLITSHYEAAFKITGSKLQAVQRMGFDGMVTNCPFCLKMFDSKQEVIGKLVNEELNMPIFYITQLLGLALGLKGEELGLNFNLSPVEKLMDLWEQSK